MPDKHTHVARYVSERVLRLLTAMVTFFGMLVLLLWLVLHLLMLWLLLVLHAILLMPTMLVPAMLMPAMLLPVMLLLLHRHPSLLLLIRHLLEVPGIIPLEHLNLFHHCALPFLHLHTAFIELFLRQGTLLPPHYGVTHLDLEMHLLLPEVVDTG